MAQRDWVTYLKLLNFRLVVDLDLQPKYTHRCSSSCCNDIIKSQDLSKSLFPYLEMGILLPGIPSL